MELGDHPPRHRRRGRPRRRAPLQRARHEAEPGRRGRRADRGAAEAPPRPGAEPRRRGQGLHGLRAGRPDAGHRGARERRRRRAPRGPSPSSRSRPRTRSRGALRSLFAVVENYPQLKANENVLALQEQLTTTENQISFSRQHYNATVNEYNTTIQTIPSVLIAGPARLHEARVLRRRAGGRPGPGRRPALTPRGRASRPRRPPWPPRSTARPRPTGGTRSCWCSSSSPCSALLGFAIGYGTTGAPAGGARMARDLRHHRDRLLARRLLLRRPGRPGGVEGPAGHARRRRPSCSTSSAS